MQNFEKQLDKFNDKADQILETVFTKYAATFFLLLFSGLFGMFIVIIIGLIRHFFSI